MKGQKLHEAQEKGIPKPCCVCNKPTLNFYGRWGDGGTCSRPCERIQEAKPKYPDHTEEEFFNRLEVKNVTTEEARGSEHAPEGARQDG